MEMADGTYSEEKGTPPERDSKKADGGEERAITVHQHPQRVSPLKLFAIGGKQQASKCLQLSNYLMTTERSGGSTPIHAPNMTSTTKKGDIGGIDSRLKIYPQQMSSSLISAAESPHPIFSVHNLLRSSQGLASSEEKEEQNPLGRQQQLHNTCSSRPFPISALVPQIEEEEYYEDEKEAEYGGQMHDSLIASPKEDAKAFEQKSANFAAHVMGEEEVEVAKAMLAMTESPPPSNIDYEPPSFQQTHIPLLTATNSDPNPYSPPTLSPNPPPEVEPSITTQLRSRRGTPSEPRSLNENTDTEEEEEEGESERAGEMAEKQLKEEKDIEMESAPDSCKAGSFTAVQPTEVHNPPPPLLPLASKKSIPRAPRKRPRPEVKRRRGVKKSLLKPPSSERPTAARPPSSQRREKERKTSRDRAAIKGKSPRPTKEHQQHKTFQKAAGRRAEEEKPKPQLSAVISTPPSKLLRPLFRRRLDSNWVPMDDEIAWACFEEVHQRSYSGYDRVADGQSAVMPWKPVGNTSWRYQLIRLSNESNAREARICFPAIRHSRIDEEIIRVGDCVKVRLAANEEVGEGTKSNAADDSRMHGGGGAVTKENVGKVMHLHWNATEHCIDATLLWYYTRDQATTSSVVNAAGSRGVGGCSEEDDRELFASSHIDTVNVDCIEGTSYVLTYNEFCRITAENKLDQLPPGRQPTEEAELWPRGEEGYRRRGMLPHEDTHIGTVYFCRGFYNWKTKRIR